MRFWKRIGLLIATVLLGSALAAGTAGSANAAPAKFDNVGNMAVVMCHHWTTAYGDGRNSKGTCKYTSDGGERRSLYTWQHTYYTFGWGDTDGFYVRRDHTVAVKSSGGTYWNRWHVWGWWKKRGIQEWYDIKQYAH